MSFATLSRCQIPWHETHANWIQMGNSAPFLLLGEGGKEKQMLFARRGGVAHGRLLHRRPFGFGVGQ
jgi:hypothetical protein